MRVKPRLRDVFFNAVLQYETRKWEGPAPKINEQWPVFHAKGVINCADCDSLLFKCTQRALCTSCLCWLSCFNPSHMDYSSSADRHNQNATKDITAAP